MIAVLDASAAIEITLNKSSARLFREALLESDLVIAPDTYPSEITNVFWKYAHFSEIEQAKCERGIDYCLDLVDNFIDTKDICQEVFLESINTKHSSYDIFYLIVARRHNAVLLTKDKKMISIAKQFKIKVLED